MHENVFLNLEDFDKEYGVELPKDVSMWSQAIIEHIQKSVPTLAGYKDLQIEFKKIDEEKGYAVGSLAVKTEKSAIQFPFVVKSFNLFPIDVFIDAEGKYRPATEERISAALFNPELTSTLVKPEDNLFTYSSTAQDMYPPSGGSYQVGRQSFASTDILNAIMESAAFKIEKVAKCIEDNPQIAVDAKFFNKTASFDKFIGYKPSMEKKASVGTDSSYYDIFQVKPTHDATRILVKMASSAIHAPIERVMDKKQAEKLAAEMAQQGQPGMQEAMANPGQTVVPDGMGSDPNSPDNFIDIEAAQSMRPIDRPGMYQVMNTFGDKLVGYAFPMVLTFDMQPAPFKVFAGMGQMAMQQEIIGSQVGMGNPGVAMIEAGKTYVFAYFGENKARQALCMVPCQVMGLTTINNKPSYLVVDMLNQVPTALFPLEGLETIMPATPDMLGEYKLGLNGAQAAFFIPMNTLAIEVTQPVQLLSSPMEAIQIMQAGGPAAMKAQQAQMQAQQQAQQPAQGQAQGQEQQMAAPAAGASGAQSPTQGQGPNQKQASASSTKQASVSRCDGRVCYDYPTAQFWIDSKSITKLATENLSKEDAAFTLIAAGASPSETEGILKQAMAKGECKIYDLVRPVEEEAHLKYLCKTASINIPKGMSFDVYPELLKLAAMITDEEDVSTVLALNFLTPENMKIFQQYLPALEKTESGLAALLMAIRLGEKNMDAKLVKDGLTKITEILNSLRKIV